MTSGDQGVFTFDLKESLWFKKGQEVNEIMGVSLEPEISIQEFDDFVSIRGVIELKGEYFQVSNEDDIEEEVLSLRDHPSQRFVDRVESYEDGVNEFFHQFPVEVSIPKYRINSIEDVMVGIETFDYDLTEKSQLQLNATVAIHGVKDTREQETVEDNQEYNPEPSFEPEIDPELVEEPPTPPVDTTESVEETFEFDVKERLEDEQESVAEEDHLDNSDVEAGEVTEESTEEPVEKPKEKAPEKDRWKYKKSQTLAEFFGSDIKKDDNVVDETEEVVEESSEFESSIINFSANTKEESSDELLESSREGGTQQDTTYLVNIFADKEEEDRYSSLKMCIVQESDTLESIAERYELSTYQISQTNKLADDEIAEGQILYIPIKD